MPEDEFHIGITMAGAASAGCYTGGAMDYLFEILDLWENAKKGKLPEGWDKELLAFIPQHKIIIDVMGGTSAGGMTTAMAAMYALHSKINPVNNPAEKEQKKDNLFYDSWVLMGDDSGSNNKKKILEKTLDIKDLVETGKVESLLNSSFIDDISEQAFKCEGKIDDCIGRLPSYISPDLEVLISHTMLRGMPLEVQFTTPIGLLRKSNQNPTHSTSEHFTISHFKLNKGIQPFNKDYLWLNPFDIRSLQILKLAVKATGAFPVGLRYKEFDKNEFSTDYLKSVTRRIVFSGFNESKLNSKIEIQWPDGFPESFPFTSVDGGAINNEPYGEVLGVLRNRWGEKSLNDYYRYALIMIDPFPDRYDPKQIYHHPNDLFEVIPAIIGTLWDQSKVKRAEMLDAYSSDYYRGVIFPVKYKVDSNSRKNDNKMDHPIACDTVMAFGGFLDLNFRHHDFFLGRDNAKNFYHFWFTLEYNKENGIVHPIHKLWTEKMVELFKVPRDGKTYLPIIPDLYYMKTVYESGKNPNPFVHTVPEDPVYDPEQLFALKNRFKERIQKILELSYKKITSSPKKDEHLSTAKAMDENYNKSWPQRFQGWVGSGILRIIFNLSKSKIAGRISQSAIDWILKDLEKKGFLKK